MAEEQSPGPAHRHTTEARLVVFAATGVKELLPIIVVEPPRARAQQVPDPRQVRSKTEPEPGGQLGTLELVEAV